MLDIPASNVRELEDLIIDCFYNELLSGKLDQLNQQFHVLSVYGRDMRPSDVEASLAKLDAWDKQLQGAQTFFENELLRGCDKSVKDSVDRQVKEHDDMCKRREEVLTEMASGSDKKGRGGQGASQGAFLQSFIPGFLNR